MIPKISVIIPVCNVEKYVEQCVRSVMNQSLREIEIICINDGSTDNSLSILKKLKNEDDRIFIVDKTNSGYGDTINVGITLAKGRYIGIIESDDFVEQDMYARLYEKAEKYGADVVKSNFNDYYTSEDKKTYNEYLINYSYEEVLSEKESLCLSGPVIWSGIYNREFILENNIRVLNTPGASYQDTGFIFKVMLCAQKVVFIKDAFVNYRNDNMGSSVNDNRKVFCICNELEEMESFLKKTGRQEWMPLYVRVKHLRYSWNLDRLQGIQKAKFLLRMYWEFKNHLDEGNLQRQYWGEPEWRCVNRLVFELPDYYKEQLALQNVEACSIQSVEDVICHILRNADSLYIYGAGKRARRLVNIFTNKDIAVTGMLVSSEKNNESNIESIPVMEIAASVKKIQDDLIIIGVAGEYQKEVVKTLKSLKLNNYILFSDAMIKLIEQI